MGRVALALELIADCVSDSGRLSCSPIPIALSSEPLAPLPRVVRSLSLEVSLRISLSGCGSICLVGRIFLPGSEAFLGGNGEVVMLLFCEDGGGGRSVLVVCVVAAVDP